MKEEKQYFKEGNVSEATSTIIILIVGIGVAILVLIFVGSLGGNLYTIVEEDIIAIGTNPVVNESFTALNNTAVSLNNAQIHEGSLVIVNGTTPFANINIANFTIDYGAGTLTLDAPIGYNATTMWASYNYGNRTIEESVRQSILSGFEALEQTGSYLPIIVLAVVIMMVLLVLLGMGGLKGKGSTGSAL